jgi:hypothetical protein
MDIHCLSLGIFQLLQAAVTSPRKSSPHLRFKRSSRSGAQALSGFTPHTSMRDEPSGSLRVISWDSASAAKLFALGLSVNSFVISQATP